MLQWFQQITIKVTKNNDKQNVQNQCKIIEVQLFKMFRSYLQLHMHFLHQNYGNLNITHVEEHV
jgi:hypothetical protein